MSVLLLALTILFTSITDSNLPKPFESVVRKRITKALQNPVFSKFQLFYAGNNLFLFHGCIRLLGFEGQSGIVSH